MPGRRPRHIRKSARNDAHCGDLKKRPSPQRDLAISLEHACEMSTNMARRGADVKKYPFKGGLFTSPEASRPPDRRAQSAQSVPSSQFPRGPRPRAPSLAQSRCPRCSRGGGRAICICVGTSFLGPFLGPFGLISAFPTSSVFKSYLTV